MSGRGRGVNTPAWMSQQQQGGGGGYPPGGPGMMGGPGGPGGGPPFRGGPPPPHQHHHYDHRRGGPPPGGGGGFRGGGDRGFHPYMDPRDRDRFGRNNRFGGGPPGGGPPYGGDRRGPPFPRGGSRDRGPPPPGGGGGGGGPPRINRNNALVIFHSLQEEMDFVEDRRRKRAQRPSKFDILPTPEQQQQQRLQQLQQQQQQLQAMANPALMNDPMNGGGPMMGGGMMMNSNGPGSNPAAATAAAMAAAAAAAQVAAASNAMLMNPQQTRHARRLYVGNLPPSCSEQQIHDKFRSAIDIALGKPENMNGGSGPNNNDPEDPILSVYINHERRFCFLEFKTVEMTTACMQLDGLDLGDGTKVKIKRPNDYNELTAPKPMQIPNLDVSRLGIISSTVKDGPNKIFIGGLHYHLQPEQILELLQAFGKVKAFHLVRNTASEADGAGIMTSKGYCFVEYADPAVTPIAIQGLNGMDIGGGKSLTARLAGERSGGGGAAVVGASGSSVTSGGSQTGVMMAAVNPAMATMAAPMAPAVMMATPMVAAGQTAGVPPPDRTIVTGYDVEELVDAAMGEKPMPTAPKYFDAMGIPLTRIVPMALTIANAVQQALGQAQQLQAQQQQQQPPQQQPQQLLQQQQPQQLVTSPAAAAAPAAPGSAGAGNNNNGVPSRVLVLHNMVSDDDLATDEEFSGLLEEVREECMNYGQLLNIQIPRLGQPGKGKIFLEYSNITEAQAASNELAGRQFGSSWVETSFYSEAAFQAGQFQ